MAEAILAPSSGSSSPSPAGDPCPTYTAFCSDVSWKLSELHFRLKAAIKLLTTSAEIDADVGDGLALSFVLCGLANSADALAEEVQNSELRFLAKQAGYEHHSSALGDPMVANDEDLRDASDHKPNAAPAVSAGDAQARLAAAQQIFGRLANGILTATSVLRDNSEDANAAHLAADALERLGWMADQGSVLAGEPRPPVNGEADEWMLGGLMRQALGDHRLQG
ncbi:MAG TPA: hypothetical protein VF453_09430 [Burkholderiaceae bacterium]